MEERRKKLRRMILLKCAKYEKGSEEQRKVGRAMREKVDDVIAWFEKNRRDMTAEDLRQVIGVESCEVP